MNPPNQAPPSPSTAGIPSQRPGPATGWGPSPYGPPPQQQWGSAGPAQQQWGPAYGQPQQWGGVGPAWGPPPPAPPTRRTRPGWVLVALIVGAALVASATWAIARPAASEPSPSGPAPVAAPAETASFTTDSTVCGDLDRVGGAFYNGYYKQLMVTGGRATAVPVQLAAQTMALTTVGAPQGQIDGSTAIASASPAVGSAMTGMVRDAAIVGKGSADSSATGANQIPDMTSMLTTFTTSTVECTKAGYQPSWFNPQELTGN